MPGPPGHFVLFCKLQIRDKLHQRHLVHLSFLLDRLLILVIAASTTLILLLPIPPNAPALLASNYIKRVLIAYLIVLPLGYWTMNKGMENIVYRIKLWVIPFLLAAILAFTVAILTVNYQTVKAATANPVDLLRYE